MQQVAGTTIYNFQCQKGELKQFQIFQLFREVSIDKWISQECCTSKKHFSFLLTLWERKNSFKECNSLFRHFTHKKYCEFSNITLNCWYCKIHNIQNLSNQHHQYCDMLDFKTKMLTLMLTLTMTLDNTSNSCDVLLTSAVSPKVCIKLSWVV